MTATANRSELNCGRKLVRSPTRWPGIGWALGLSFTWVAYGFLVQSQSNGISRADEPFVATRSEDGNEAIDSILKRLVLDALPHQYSDTKKWGGQSHVYDGFRFRNDDGRLETKRVWKMANDGTWRKYSAELIDPQQQLEVHLRELRQLPDGKLAFDLVFVAHLRLHARQSKWVKGLQLYSLSADGSAKVQLALHCELSSRLDLTKFPPEILFQPDVKSAKLDVMEFRIDHVSKIGGEVAQQVTEAVRSRLRAEIDSKENDLVKKINLQLEKNRDKLRLKLADAAKLPWAPAATPLMPDDIRNALPKGLDKN